jgi:hypothetical protein
MTLSEKLQARLDANREAQAPKAPRKRNDPFLLSGLALGLSAGVAAFAFGTGHPANDLPQTPDWRSKVSHVSRSELGEPIPAATVSQAPAAPTKAATKCIPYASNGTYLPELCGDYDAFAAKADRAVAPYNAKGQIQK